jgi:hypothetical protein
MSRAHFAEAQNSNSGPIQMTHALKIRRAFLLSTIAAISFTAANAQDKNTFDIYGFAMADFIYDTKRVDPDWQDAFRPSKIATFDDQFGDDGQSSISVKQSKFGVKGIIPAGDDIGSINFKFEFDLFGTGDDAGQTTFRLRHAYAEWGPLLAGQTHSLFMDIDIFPNVIDYWGPTGMVFYRNVQIRYTPWKNENSYFAIAIERPGNDVDAGQIRELDPNIGPNITASEELPDFTAHYRYNADWGHFQIAGILRSVGFETQGTVDNEPKGEELGWGIDLTGHVNFFEKDKLYLGVVFGEGIASYMNDGGTDLAPGGTLLDPDAEAVELLGVEVWYDHWWNDKWSTSLGYSFTEVDNTTLQDPGAFQKGDYASINLLYQPSPKIMIGGEVMWGQRENADGNTGDDIRFQFSARYNFDTSITF